MHSFSRLSSFLFCLILALPVSGQSVIGTVFNIEGSPQEGALVFISNTSIQGMTDAEGKFSLDAPIHSTFEVVATTEEGMLGKGLFTIGETDFVRIQMDSAPDTPDGTSTRSREELMDFFVSTAFSWTKNSGDIEMVNPEVLNIDFDEANSVISVTADAPFEFLNPALGYSIKIYDFTLGGSQVAFGWGGYPLYSELTPEKSKDTKNWNKNREKIYEGSLRHFLKSLADDRVKKAEYAAYFVEGPGAPSDHSPILEAGLKGIYGAPQPVMFDGRPADAKRLDFGGWVRVVYYGNGGDSRWERFIDRFWPVSDMSEVLKSSLNNSWITLPDYQAFFDPNTGVLLPSSPPSTQVMGYWTFFRMADMLPDDWMPEK